MSDNGPELERGIPDPPKWLAGAALDHWRELVPELDEMGVLTTADGSALALLCSAWAECLAADEAIAEHGLTQTRTTAAGSTSVALRPEVALRSDAWKRYKSMLVEFGLTPSARTRVAANPERKAGKLKRFLDGE